MSLRTNLVRLAHLNPALRPHLLPILADDGGRVAAMPTSGTVGDLIEERKMAVLKVITLLIAKELGGTFDDSESEMGWYDIQDIPFPNGKKTGINEIWMETTLRGHVLHLDAEKSIEMLVEGKTPAQVAQRVVQEFWKQWRLGRPSAT